MTDKKAPSTVMPRASGPAGIPRNDKIARALLAGLRTRLASDPTEAEALKWKPLILATLNHLAAHGFDRRRAWDRIKRALLPYGISR